VIIRQNNKIYIDAFRLTVLVLLVAIAFLFGSFIFKYTSYIYSLYRSYELSKSYYDFDGSFLDYKRSYEHVQGETLFNQQPIIHDYYHRRYYTPEVVGHTLGFRQVPPTKEERAGKTLILAIGSSTTESGYPTELASLLEGAHPGRYLVVNASVPGISMLSLFMNYALLWRRLAPDIVIIEHNVEDAVWNPFVVFDIAAGFAKPCSDDPILGTLANQSVGQRIRWMRQAIRQFDLGSMTRLSEPSKEGLKQYDTVLRSLITLVKGSESRPLLVTYQAAFHPEDLRGEFTEETYASMRAFFQALFLGYTFEGAVRTLDAHNEIMRRIARDDEVPLVETVGRIPRRDEYYDDATHHSELANRIVAEAILDVLQREGYLESDR